MPKCCAYGIPNDPEGPVIRFTLCTADDQPCPQFAAWLNLGSWQVAECIDCKPPETRPKLKCCAYGIPNDPEGPVIRFTLCTPESEPCPQFAAYLNMASWVVADCQDCRPPLVLPVKTTPLAEKIEETIDIIARAPSILEKLRKLGLLPQRPSKP